jgi:transcriptional regulator with XRE-family HTH domain
MLQLKQKGEAFQMSYDVGERIREFRKQAGLNQDQLAELSSLNRVTVAKYESGKVEPGAKALSRIADALEVSVDILLGRSTDEAISSPEQDEAWAIRERLRRDPAYRLLFDAADNASPEHLRAAAAMLKALEPKDGDGE